MDDYPSNSRRPPVKPEETKTPPLEEIELPKVVTGKVLRRKKPLGRRFMETFFTGDSNSVFGYLFKEVLIPALQDVATNLVTQGIEKAVYGEVRSPHRPTRGMSSPRNHISYDRYDRPTPGGRPSSAIRSTPPKPTPQRHADALTSIVLATKMEVEVVLERLGETIETYECATVAHLNSLLGETSAYTDHKWGWTDLTHAGIRRVREGWCLILPEPEDLR